MKSALALASCVLLFIFVPGALKASAVPAGGQQSGAPQSGRPSQLDEAERLAAEAVELARQKKYDKALPLARRVLDIRERELGPEHASVAVALRDLSELLFARGQPDEARPLYERFLTALEKHVGASDPRMVEALERYVCFQVAAGRREESLRAQKRLYKAENGFDYDEAGSRPGKNLAAGGLMLGKVVSAPPPEYSSAARAARAFGSVVMKVTVDEAGKVVEVKTMCGNAVLTKGAEASVRKSRFEPTLAAGKPVKVTGVIIYNFAPA